MVPRSVLIVDDNQAVRQAMRCFLESKTSWRVADEAADGAEAIQKAMASTTE